MTYSIMWDTATDSITTSNINNDLKSVMLKKLNDVLTISCTKEKVPYPNLLIDDTILP